MRADVSLSLLGSKLSGRPGGPARPCQRELVQLSQGAPGLKLQPANFARCIMCGLPSLGRHADANRVWACSGEQGAVRGAAADNQPQPKPCQQPQGQHQSAIFGALKATARALRMSVSRVEQAELLGWLPCEVNRDAMPPGKRRTLHISDTVTASAGTLGAMAHRAAPWGGVQSVVSQRFRDVSDEIRTVVISGLGDWVFAHPADYLQDEYLKYIAWALSDRVPAPASMSYPSDTVAIMWCRAFAKGNRLQHSQQQGPPQACK